MAFNSRLSTASKRKKEFSSESSCTITGITTTQQEVFEEVRLTSKISSENYVVVKDYVTDVDGFVVNVGDIVEVIEHNGLAKKTRMDPDLEVEISDILDNSAAKHKLSIRPRRNHVDPRTRSSLNRDSDLSLERVYVRTTDGRQGWLPTSILMQTALSEESLLMSRPEDSYYRREAVVKELIETEEEFDRDLQLVVERYLKPLDNLGVPRAVRDNKEIIFTNLKQIADFHNTRVLIEGVKYYADQPRMLGRTFLRLINHLLRRCYLISSYL